MKALAKFIKEHKSEAGDSILFYHLFSNLFINNKLLLEKIGFAIDWITKLFKPYDLNIRFPYKFIYRGDIRSYLNYFYSHEHFLYYLKDWVLYCMNEVNFPNEISFKVMVDVFGDYVEVYFRKRRECGFLVEYEFGFGSRKVLEKFLYAGNNNKRFLSSFLEENDYTILYLDDDIFVLSNNKVFIVGALRFLKIKGEEFLEFFENNIKQKVLDKLNILFNLIYYFSKNEINARWNFCYCVNTGKVENIIKINRKYCKKLFGWEIDFYTESFFWDEMKFVYNLNSIYIEDVLDNYEFRRTRIRIGDKEIFLYEYIYMRFMEVYKIDLEKLLKNLSIKFYNFDINLLGSNQYLSINIEVKLKFSHDDIAEANIDSIVSFLGLSESTFVDELNNVIVSILQELNLMITDK